MRRKLFVLLMVTVMVCMFTGCGAEETKVTNSEIVSAEVQEIETEEVTTEKKVKTVDNEFQQELEYNSRTNNYWGN